MANQTSELISIEDAVAMGRVIRAQRKALKLRIDDAALQCNVSVSLLSGLERGTRPVAFPTVLAIARQLGIRLFASPKQIGDAE